MKILDVKDIIAIIILLITASGCGTVRHLQRDTEVEFKPVYFDKSSFPSAGIKTLTVLPVVDLRKDKSVILSEHWPADAFTAYWELIGIKELYMPNEEFRNKLATQRGFKYKYLKDYGGVSRITQDYLEELDISWIKKLGNTDDKYIFLLVMDDLVSENDTFGLALSGNCSGYIFSKVDGKLIWKHKSTQKRSWGGLVGIAARNNKESPLFVVNFCFGDIYRQLPGLK